MSSIASGTSYLAEQERELSSQATEVGRSNFTPLLGKCQGQAHLRWTGVTFPREPCHSGDVAVKEEGVLWERCHR